MALNLRYMGSGHHKKRPADYGFQPPSSPRPGKSICDGLRAITKIEAEQLLRSGIEKGMFSKLNQDGLPKHIWSVDSSGEVYEANIGRDGYHGYRLEEEDDQRKAVLEEWKRR